MKVFLSFFYDPSLHILNIHARFQLSSLSLFSCRPPTEKRLPVSELTPIIIEIITVESRKRFPGVINIVARHDSLPYRCIKRVRAKREGGTKSLSQQYMAASEATCKIPDEDVTLREVLFSRRHALIRSHCLERLCVMPSRFMQR